MDVRQVLTRLRHLGLDVRGGGRTGHHKVYDPKTGAWLFDVAKTPGDPNWHYNIQRNLKRIGLSLVENGGAKRKKSVSQVGKRKPAVDLEALQRAQEAARAAGEREPQLGDLDEAPPSSPLWNRVVVSGSSGKNQLGVEAESEVIDNMVARADTARVKYVRGRLENFMMEKGDELAARARKRFPNTRPGMGKIAEFARVAMYEVAPARNIRSWKTQAAAEQSVSKFLRDENMGLSVWSMALIEATMDHINGMKWGVYEIPKTEDELDAEIVRQRDETDTGERIAIEDLQAQADVTEAVEDAAESVESVESVKKSRRTSRRLVAPPKPPDAKESVAPVEPWKPYDQQPMSDYKSRYVEQLLKMLESGEYSDTVVAEEVLPRLDKLLLEDS